MLHGLFKAKLTTIQKICLAGLFIAVTTILQKVLAINYIPIIPFLRISLGGPAMIIFSSIFLGPVYGLAIGAISDVLGYFLLDPKMMGFLPQITAIYALLGFVSFFIFWLIKFIKNDKLMLIIEGSVFASLIVGVGLFIFLKPNLQLYGSTYTLVLWQKILIPSLMLVLFSALFASSILFNKHYKSEKLPIGPIQISFSCFAIEILVMVLFGTLMKGWAFGFSTFPMIVICQLIVMFINIPLNAWLIILLLGITNRYYSSKEMISKSDAYGRR